MVISPTAKEENTWMEGGRPRSPRAHVSHIKTADGCIVGEQDAGALSPGSRKILADAKGNKDHFRGGRNFLVPAEGEQEVGELGHGKKSVAVKDHLKPSSEWPAEMRVSTHVQNQEYRASKAPAPLTKYQQPKDHFDSEVWNAMGRPTEQAHGG